MTFLLSLDLIKSPERESLAFVMEKAAQAGTPFRSLFSPHDIIKRAENKGLKNLEYVSAEEIYYRYFSRRDDGLRAGQAEGFLIAEV
jgi:hypothetical protein